VAIRNKAKARFYSLFRLVLFERSYEQKKTMVVSFFCLYDYSFAITIES